MRFYGALLLTLLGLGASAMAQDRPETRPETPAHVPSTTPIWQDLRENDAAYQACLWALDMMDVGYEPLDQITDLQDLDCGIARPLNIHRLGSVDIENGAVMRCSTARRLAEWTHRFVQPASLAAGLGPIATYVPGSTYQCRDRVGDREARLSEHALGNAFDLMAITWADDQRVEIAPRGDDGDLIQAFQRSIRATACLGFTTVLGPDTNASHDDHLHLDIKHRKNGWRLCQ